MSKAFTRLVAAMALLALAAIPTAAANGTTTGLWDTSVTPACIADGTAPCLVNDPGGVELGVKFQTSNPINVLGVRFYRADDGTWSGSLWDADSTFITQATDSTSGAGWQTAMFSSPQPMGTGDTFIASYFAPGGQYAFEWDYFTGGGHTVGPVTALGGAGVNGLFTYSEQRLPDDYVPRHELLGDAALGRAVRLHWLLPADRERDVEQGQGRERDPREVHPRWRPGPGHLPGGLPEGDPDRLPERVHAYRSDRGDRDGGRKQFEYDATLDQYTYVWKTSKAWATKCYRFELGLNDLTSHTFDVQFAK